MATPTYASIIGIVQHFPGKAIVTERTVNDQRIREFTIKSTSTGKLVRITLWPEFPEIEIEKGTTISADGKTSVNDGNNGMKFYGLTPTTLCILPPVVKLEREGTPGASEDDDNADEDDPLF